MGVVKEWFTARSRGEGGGGVIGGKEILSEDPRAPTRGRVLEKARDSGDPLSIIDFIECPVVDHVHMALRSPLVYVM
jgi:hypothetical protein